MKKKKHEDEIHTICAPVTSAEIKAPCNLVGAFQSHSGHKYKSACSPESAISQWKTRAPWWSCSLCYCRRKRPVYFRITQRNRCQMMQLHQSAPCVPDMLEMSPPFASVGIRAKNGCTLIVIWNNDPVVLFVATNHELINVIAYREYLRDTGKRWWCSRGEKK